MELGKVNLPKAFPRVTLMNFLTPDFVPLTILAVLLLREQRAKEMEEAIILAVLYNPFFI